MRYDISKKIPFTYSCVIVMQRLKFTKCYYLRIVTISELLHFSKNGSETLLRTNKRTTAIICIDFISSHWLFAHFPTNCQTLFSDDWNEKKRNDDHWTMFAVFSLFLWIIYRWKPSNDSPWFEVIFMRHLINLGNGLSTKRHSKLIEVNADEV